MLANRMTIDSHDYLLDAMVDVEALQVEICDAMRKGGGIVRFTTRHRPLTAIVSPGVPVFFEEVEIVEPDPVEPADPTAAFVLDELDGY